MEMAGKADDLNAVNASMAELEAQFDVLKQAMTYDLLCAENRMADELSLIESVTSDHHVQERGSHRSVLKEIS